MTRQNSGETASRNVAAANGTLGYAWLCNRRARLLLRIRYIVRLFCRRVIGSSVLGG
jgi:hypothetical protein